MHVIATAVQELYSYHKRISLDWGMLSKGDLQAKKPSSSSLREGAGSGAPGASFDVGSLT